MNSKKLNKKKPQLNKSSNESSDESSDEDQQKPSFGGESVEDYVVKRLDEFDYKPRMWDEKDLEYIVIMELLELSQVLIYDPVKLYELLVSTEFFGSHGKELIRLNLEKRLLAFRIEKKAHIKKLLKITCISESDDDNSDDDEFHGSDPLENMKLPVRCYSVDQNLKKEERWWEDKNCVVMNKMNIVRFSNDEDMESSQLDSIVRWSRYLKVKEDYFVGMCQHCCISASPDKKLSRCGGCQLVGYCSRDCQKADRKVHKEVCKELSVSHCGVNILRRAQQVVEGIKPIEKKKELFFAYLHLVDTNKDFLNNRVSHTDLLKTSEMAEDCDIEFRFNVLKFPRICNMCCEARLEMLQDCKCKCVAYCSDDHRNTDRKHQARCKSLGMLADTYAYRRKKEPINNLTYPSKVDINYQPFENMESLLESFKDSMEQRSLIDESSEPSYIQSNLVSDISLDVKLTLLSERLSLPLTCLHVLQQVGVGPDKTPIEDVTSLNILNLCLKPMLDSGAWEFFLHRLPRLKELRVTYTEEMNADIHVMSINHLNTNTTLTRCQDCTSMDRLITYSIFPLPYEMYISSEYPVPDVVTIAQLRELVDEDFDEFEETTEFYTKLMEDKGQECRVIFTDSSLDKLCETISEIEEVVTMDVLISPKENKFAGSSQVRIMDTNEGMISLNCRQFVSCLIGSNEKSVCYTTSKRIEVFEKKNKLLGI